MKLIIFDLDQTLVDFLPLHDQAMQKLFLKFFGVAARFSEIDFAGRSLTENFQELARLKNIPEKVFREKSRELLGSYETTFGESIPEDSTGYILPGARELLEALPKTDNLIVLYTGDSPGIVSRVFTTTGLGKYFKFCFYGTEVQARADMVGLAIEKAESLTGQKFRDKDIVIIGDSIRDIECGRLFNALTISVATGFHSAAQLARARPDYLFKDLRNTQKVLRAIG
ncbi:MAG: HAD family hydrolase [Chloroflexi bacterium]|nr:HAD family hydrolase [Chloroflexota bacterium]